MTHQPRLGLYNQLRGNAQRVTLDLFTTKIVDDVLSDYLKNKTMSEKLRLFQYAVVLHTVETTRDEKGIIKSQHLAELIVEPKFVMAKNDKEVVFKATREIPADKASDPDNVEILVRPF